MSYHDLRIARIQLSDTVVVVTDDGGLTHEQDAVVIHTPQGPGDLWQFQRPDGSVFALNPYHGSLIRIEKAPPEQPRVVLVQDAS